MFCPLGVDRPAVREVERDSADLRGSRRRRFIDDQSHPGQVPDGRLNTVLHLVARQRGRLGLVIVLRLDRVGLGLNIFVGDPSTFESTPETPGTIRAK